MGKKNNLGRAIIKDRFKSGRKKSGGSFVSYSSRIVSHVVNVNVSFRPHGKTVIETRRDFPYVFSDSFVQQLHCIRIGVQPRLFARRPGK